MPEFFIFIHVCGHIIKFATNNLHFRLIRYLSTEKLPSRMLSLQSSNAANFESASGEEDCTRDEEIPKNVIFRSCPFDIGGLQIISLGNLACESMSSESLYIRIYLFSMFCIAHRSYCYVPFLISF